MDRLFDTREQYLQENVKSLQTCIDLMQKYVTTPEERENFLQHIQETVKGYCLDDNKFQKSKRAIRETENFVNNDDTCMTEVKQIYERTLANLPAEANYQENKIWKSLSKKLEECSQRPGTSDDMNASTSSQNRSVVCSQTFQIPIDPLTKKPVQNPCKNTACGHIYDYESIMIHIKSKRDHIKCPYIGCTNKNVKKRDIVFDEELRERIANSSVHSAFEASSIAIDND